MSNQKIIGIDVGGSHVTAGIIDIANPQNEPACVIRKDIDAFDSAHNIINTIADCIKEVQHKDNSITSIGIAFPGPFLYEKGVSAIAHLGGKYRHTFALHIKQALKDATGIEDISISFINDAHAFAIGAYHRYNLKSKRTNFLTLGTGFGSAFMEEGVILNKHAGISAIGAFYNEPFLSATADDCFSTRWLLSTYKTLSGIEAASVKEIAISGNDAANTLFKQFGENLGDFLSQWLERFECDELMIGGNIAKAHALFDASLRKHLKGLSKPVTIIYCEDTEDCILAGAALHAVKQPTPIQHVRKTTQTLLPLTIIEKTNTEYRIYPHYSSGKNIYASYSSLAEKIAHEKTIIIDGYGGVLWETFREQMHAAFSKLNKKVFWYDINACLKSSTDISDMITQNLNGDDPVFGTKYTGALIDFFDTDKLKLIIPDAAADICIVYGTGAALANIKGTLVYLDVPKNEIQYRMRAGNIRNLGTDDIASNQQNYKRLYFVDWPVLNLHKQQLLPTIDYIVDEQRATDITWMPGEDFRNTLNDMMQSPLRARPWFEAGVWGGDWMKKHIPGLNIDEVNYAWSFELITPENGVVIEGNTLLMEVSFDFLLYYDNKKILGKAADKFGVEFPIRFDFLDTYNGGNLSIQCHPRTAYIKEKFGESFTQDETYYILDCEPDAHVYLGFQDTINPTEFKTALYNAQDSAVEIPIEHYVQKHPAHKHDLFLIPNGTIHASGKNNLVLEISSTPYIFTFKMYDWLRLDLTGKPRLINIEHAFNNLYFDRKGDYVPQHLISKPYTIDEWPNGRKVKLPTHEEHFYTVDRYEFTGEIAISTNGQCHCCMLVQGSNIDIKTRNKTDTFRYAETFVIPASVDTYTVTNPDTEKAYLVIAYVKDNHC